MDTSGEEGSQRINPTVPQEKWVEHAKRKLARGYVLIVNPTRPNANFFRQGKGYEMCPYRTALHLIKEGAVVETGTHHLGAVYKLAP